jgi:PKD repeat protein
MTRHILACLVLAGLLLTGGCGTSGGAPTGAAGLSTADTRVAPLLQLPVPATLRGVSYTEASLTHSGSEFDTAQLPRNNVTVSGSAAAFAPNWTPGTSNAATGMAYAGYVFGADGYDRETTIRFTWTTEGAPGDLFIGLGNFVRNRWDFYQAAATNGVTVTSQQFNDAIEPGTGRFMVMVITMGTQPWELASIRLGNLTAPDITAIGPPNGAEGAQVTFNLLASGGPIDTFDWNFGGAGTPNTSTQMSPQITLGTPGTYPVSVTATNAAGSDTFNFNFVVDAPPAAPDIVSFGPLTGATGTDVVFSADNQGGAATSWDWDFGGAGTPATSTLPTPTVTLGAVGTYTVSVTATNATGSDTFSADFNVTMGNPPPLIQTVEFSSGGLMGAPGQAVTLQATILGTPPFSYDWQFGTAATPPTSTLDTPAETLSNTPGTYPCSLTVMNADGSDTFNFDIVVAGGGTPPDITLVTPDSGSQGQVVTFVPTFTGDQPITWDWDFGGGATPNNPGDIEQPVETLGAPFPSYIVTVTATNAAGSDQYQFMLSVFP